MPSLLRSGLAAHLPAKLIDELLEAHAEVKRNYFLGGLRLSAVEGGRFAESAFRLLEFITTGKHTRLGSPLNTDKIIRDVEQLAVGSHPDSIRIHIPRALRLIYDIRNKRDVAHLADGIDPNLQDATLVVGVTDWVLAEFVRLYHSVNANEAQKIVVDLVTRAVPIIQEFDGHLKVLNPMLGASDCCLVLLYQRGTEGASQEELARWIKPSMRANLTRTLNQLDANKAFVHATGIRFFITRSGQKAVETRKLLEPS